MSHGHLELNYGQATRVSAASAIIISRTNYPISVLMGCIELGMCAIFTLMDHPNCHIHWDHPVEYCRKVSEQTNMFLEIEGVVGMLDGKTLVTLQPGVCAEQNRDYSG